MHKNVNTICEQCDSSFEVTWKYRKQRFCSRQCMYDWRKEQNWTTSICENCGNEIKHRKKDTRIFCSDVCMKTSDWKRELTRQQWIDDNPMDNPLSKEKMKKSLKGRNVGFGSEGKKSKHTKKSKSGMSKIKKKQYKQNKDKILAKRDETYLEKYGMTCGEYFTIKGNEYAESRGVNNVLQLPEFKRKARNKISKGQRFLYEQIKKDYLDAELEYWLSDAKRNVDIFIPSKNKIIEYYGKYWHCDPNKYSPNYYHRVMKKTAQEIWNRDKERVNILEENGYEVEIVWEE